MSNPYKLTTFHQKAATRMRRTILHFDAFGRYSVGKIKCIDDYMQQQFEYIDNISHHVDSIFWDIMYNGDEYAIYPSNVLPQRLNGPMENLIKQGVDFFKILTNKGQKLGMENILVHRISEVDLHCINPHKEKHPEMYVKSWLWSGLHNLAIPEIRQKKLTLLTECIKKYPFDGLEIDFCRHTPFLPPGKQWELRDHVTQFMRMLRSMLMELEVKLERPLLLSARIPETLTGCKIDGIDVEQWSTERIVDALTLGDRNFNVDIEDFRQITAGSGIKLFPCYDAHHTVDGYAEPSIEIYRGIFANWWDRGADGVKLFNWHTASYETYVHTFSKNFTLPAHCQDKAMCEVGDADIMHYLDKTFVVERKGGYPWGEGYANHNWEKPLPMILPNNGDPRMIDIYVCDHIAQRQHRISNVFLDIVTYGMEKGDKLQVLLNGYYIDGTYDWNWDDKFISAPEPAPISGYGSHQLPTRIDRMLLRLHYTPDCGAFVKGYNRIEVVLIRGSQYEHCKEATLEKAEITVRYN